MQIELLKFPYSYMEYEKILQIRELKVLLPEIEVLSDDKHNTIISGERINLDNVKELTFYRAYKLDGISYPTRQGLYEKDDTLRAVKQHTRYSTHGIHEYKGKFNPQIVHAIANIFGVQRGHKVLDPFDGSGTTIIKRPWAEQSTTLILLIFSRCSLSNVGGKSKNCFRYKLTSVMV